MLELLLLPFLLRQFSDIFTFIEEYEIEQLGHYSDVK